MAAEVGLRVAMASDEKGNATPARWKGERDRKEEETFFGRNTTQDTTKRLSLLPSLPLLASEPLADSLLS